MSDISDLEAVAVTRDLARRPEIRAVAYALAKINETPSTAPVDRFNIPPLYVMLAYRILTNKPKRDALLALIQMIGD